MVTIWALCCGVIPGLLFVIWDSSLFADYPLILYIIAAVGVFMYQTLDALDGKQARRIKAFSPLGQLFDHGCDSFSTASMVIFLLVGLKIPDARLNLAIYLAYISVVYMSNLAEKYTHVLTTSYGIIGVTEIQFAQMLFLLATGFGLTWWIYVPIFGTYSINYLVAYIIIGITVFVSSVFLRRILATEHDRTEIFTSIAPLGYIAAMSRDH
jgi:phosphatidylglycerophosphate synthase